MKAQEKIGIVSAKEMYYCPNVSNCLCPDALKKQLVETKEVTWGKEGGALN